MTLRTRPTLGPKFNEGARLMWLAIERHGWSAESIGDAIRLPHPTVWRYLYGDRRPARAEASRIQATLGIEPTEFDRDAQEPFTPPGARAATGTDG